MLEVQELQQRGRAMNAVQEFLVHKLLFPKVYLDVDWNGNTVDVLAIDRSGVGDVHAVRFVNWEVGLGDDHGYSSFLEKAVSAEVNSFTGLLRHFVYIAIICAEPNKQKWIPSKEIKKLSLAADGVGRIGILYVDVTEENTEVEVLLKAERFRSSKELVALSDSFVAEHTANWEYREEL
jgi:hypothetical protein